MSLVPALKDEGDRAGMRGPQTQRTQSALVCAQMALACVLLIGAGLLVHSFQAAQDVPLGFNPDHLLTIRVTLNSQSTKPTEPDSGFLGCTDRESSSVAWSY